MGTYFIELGSSIRPSNVIYDRAGSSISQIREGEFDWAVLLQDQKWLFISGITPALSETCAKETIKIAKIASQIGVKVSFDMNYRRKLWDDKNKARAIFDQILENTDLLFGNTGVLADIYDMQAKGDNAIEETINIIETSQEKFGLNQLAFTVREHASASTNRLSGVYTSKESDTIISSAYTVGILDRFGTGDSFAAGMLHGIGKGWSNDQNLNFATAAFALKHTIAGDQHTSSEEEIKSIMNGNISGHVLR